MSTRQSGRFVGRQAQMEAFKKMLDQSPEKPRMFFNWGPGGIGKTWLTQQMLQEAAKRSDLIVLDRLIDMYSTSHRYIEGVMSAVVERLRPRTDACDFEEYDQARQELVQARSQKDYTSEGLENKLKALMWAFQKCLQRTRAKKSVVVAFDTFEHVANGPVGKWILSEEGFRIPGIICIVAGRELENLMPGQPQLGGLSGEEAVDFYYRYTYSTEERSPELEQFVERLNKKAEGNPLILGLAALGLRGGVFSPEKLEDLNTEDFRREIVLGLRFVDPEGSRNLGELDLDEPMYQTLVCMAYLNRRFNEFFLERLITNRYVRLNGTTQERIWQQLQQPHFFFVKERPEGEVQLHDELADLFRQHLLPDVFGDLEDIPGEKWERFTGDVVTWYDELIEHQRAISEAAVDVLKVDKLAYVLQLDAPRQRRQPDFAQAKQLLIEYSRDRSDILDRLIINEVKPEVVELFEKQDRYELYTLLGEISRRAYLLEPSQRYWTCAFEIAREMGLFEQQVQALIAQHNSTWQLEPKSSLAILERAFAISAAAEKLRPDVLYEIGFTHRQMENLEEAIKWYKEAQKMAAFHHQGNVMRTVLNDMGYAYLQKGDYGEAEIHINKAGELRQRHRDILSQELIKLEERMNDETTPDEQRQQLTEQKNILEDQVHDATLKLGMTYNTLGEMGRYQGDLAQATINYSQALSIFNKEGAHYWIAKALHGRGDAHRRLAADSFNKNRKESSASFEERAQEDIETSLKLCEQYGFVQESHTAHRRMGRLLHDRAFRVADPKQQIDLLDQALQFFEKGLQIAQEVGNTLEELENLTEIAFLADDRVAILRQHFPDKAREEEKKITKYIERLRQGIERHKDDDPRIYQFSVFENLLKIEEGAFYFALGDYAKSLEYYVEGYVGLASDPGYGSARYKAHFEHLFGNIQKLEDTELQKAWYERFVSEWKQNSMLRGDPKTLAEFHPELVRRCELDQSTAFMFE